MKDVLQKYKNKLETIYEELANLTDDVYNIQRTYEEDMDEEMAKHVSQTQKETASDWASDTVDAIATARDETGNAIDCLQELIDAAASIEKSLEKQPLINETSLLLYVTEGLKDGIIQVVKGDLDHGCAGIVCQIGDTQFYFENNEDAANAKTLEEYYKMVKKEELPIKITEAIYQAHLDLDMDTQDDETPEDGEFYQYYLTLKAHYIEKEENKTNNENKT